MSALAAESISVKVPFDFQIGKQEFDAGKYRLVVDQSGPMKVIDLESGKESMISGQVPKGGIVNNSKIKLVFYRYGNQHFLREVHGSSNSLKLRESQAERMARAINQDRLAKVILKVVRNKAGRD